MVVGGAGKMRLTLARRRTFRVIARVIIRVTVRVIIRVTVRVISVVMRVISEHSEHIADSKGERSRRRHISASSSESSSE